MIVYKQWKEKALGSKAAAHCDGWFLFGLIPFYIRKFKL